MADQDAIPVEQIQSGECFMKLGGQYTYLAISESAVRYLGLRQGFLYGVCFNGNVTSIPYGRKVVRVSIDRISEDFASQQEWERSIGVKS